MFHVLKFIKVSTNLKIFTNHSCISYGKTVDHTIYNDIVGYHTPYDNIVGYYTPKYSKVENHIICMMK